MFRTIIATLLMSSIITIGCCDATIESWDPGTGTGTIGPGGCVEL